MHREPVAIIAAVRELISAALKMLVILNLVVWSAEQTAAILLVADAALTVISTTLSRSQVTPLAAPRLPADTPVEYTA